VRQALATSPESQANVQNIFTQSLQRPASAEDVQYFTNAIASGGLLSDARRDIAASPEAQGLLGTPVAPVAPVTPVTPAAPGAVTPVTPVAPVTPVTPVAPVTPVTPAAPGAPVTPVAPVTPGVQDNSGTVNDLYQKVFGRDADSVGLAYWGNLLSQGTPLADIEAGLRGSAEFASPAAQRFQRGTRTVPFGSQLLGGGVQQMAQYAQPPAQAGPAMGAPSLQGFLGSNPAAAALSPFQQSLQYQAALPSMIQPFNPADIPATYQQTLSPTPRLDISTTQIPGWLQASIDAQRAKDGIEISDADKFRAANTTVTNSGLNPNVTTPGTTTGGLLAAGQISPQIISGYTDYLGRAPGSIDLSGASYWQNLLNAGTPIADIYSGIAGTAEGLLYAPTRAANLAAADTSTVNYVE
jgi:hypothetical protein